MGIFDWFRKKEPEDFEQVLAALALDIQKRQARLSEIRLRERRTTLLITLYTFAIWAAYVIAWYAGWRPLKALPIFIGPIIIQFSRRIAQTWYERIGNAEEKTLKELLSQQRSKVEEFKRQTNYYSTKNLIERYDSPSATASPARSRPDGPSGLAQQKPQQPITAQRLPQDQPYGFTQTSRGHGPNMAVLGPQIPQAPLVPPRKQWYDRLADALLGEEGSATDGVTTRFALICQNCFAHNGLVKQELWEDTQYVCPKCGFFNPSVRALKAGHAGQRSPTSPQQAEAHQRRSAPRLSAPISSAGPLLHIEEAERNRRRSMPAPDVGTLADDEDVDPRHIDAKPRKRRSPLAQNISLPDDEDEDDAEVIDIEEEEEQPPLRRRRALAEHE